MKFTVQVVILNDEGKVLAVSRKDDHNDFGLPGGKVEDQDWREGSGLFMSLSLAMLRELKEETGLEVYTYDPIFAIHKGGYMGYTFLAKKWGGEIEFEEPHIVEWVPFETIIAGSFGKYNKLVAESLTDMGVEFKMHDDSNIGDTYYFHITQEEDEDPYICIVSQTFWNQEKCLSDSMSEEEGNDIYRMCRSAEISLGEASESVYELSHKVGDKWTYTNNATLMEELMLKAGFKKNEDFSKFLTY